MNRIREVKWPWENEDRIGFKNPLRVQGLRAHARFLCLMFIDEYLRLFFEEAITDHIGKDRHFAIYLAHNGRFSIPDGGLYLASAPIHGARLCAHIYQLSPATSPLYHHPPGGGGRAPSTRAKEIAK